jgi:hypothetical protein
VSGEHLFQRVEAGAKRWRGFAKPLSGQHNLGIASCDIQHRSIPANANHHGAHVTRRPEVAARARGAPELHTRPLAWSGGQSSRYMAMTKVGSGYPQ